MSDLFGSGNEVQEYEIARMAAQIVALVAVRDWQMYVHEVKDLQQRLGEQERHTKKAEAERDAEKQARAAIAATAADLADERDRLREALDLVDAPYPIDVFPDRTDEQRDAIFAAMRAVDKYATEWFYAWTARDRGRVVRIFRRRTEQRTNHESHGQE